MRGFEIKCLCCGESDGVSVNVGNLDEFHCSSCDGDFTRDEVETMLANWRSMLAWLDKAPKRD